MQSWGHTSRFSERDTGMEPTKSGVLGLICAALGKPRDEQPEHIGLYPSLSDLATLRMGVRIDSPGKMGVDFQTAGGGKLGKRPYGVAKADGSSPETVMSWRYFLQDAVFLVGLESSNVELLANLHIALMKPAWPIYLGRKSYVPGGLPYLTDGLQDGRIEDVFASYPPLIKGAFKEGRIRVIIDDPDGRERRVDVPLDYARRRFGLRNVSITYITVDSSKEQEVT
jgi:CRISPR system Cascade subunit CasD